MGINPSDLKNSTSHHGTLLMGIVIDLSNAIGECIADPMLLELDFEVRESVCQKVGHYEDIGESKGSRVFQ